MKSHWTYIGLAITGLGLASITRAEKPTHEKRAAAPDVVANVTEHPKMVQVQVEFVELSHEALTKLLFLSKPTSSDATDLRKQVQEMVSKNEAKVLDTQILTAKQGQKATTESLHEYIYPTEYEPPMLPNSVNTEPPPKSNLGPFPTAFETRNLGSTLEVEPTVGNDNRTIDLRFVPEIVYHTGDTVWHEGKDPGGNPFTQKMPDIYSMRLNTSLLCISGQYSLAGSVSPKDANGELDATRKVMVFVKCDVLTVK